jgi:hypothetical protein
MSEPIEGTTNTIEEELLAKAAMVSEDLVAMAKEQIMEKNGKLFVQKDRKGLHFVTPADWWGMVGVGVGLTPANRVQFGPASWQAELFGHAMDLLGLKEVLETKQVSGRRKGGDEAGNQQVFTVSWDDLATVLGNSRASIAWKNAEFRESRKQTNRLMYGQNFAAKVQRFNKYQGEAILMLLQGKNTAYPEENFNGVFVQESGYMQKNPKAKATKAQYEVVMTGEFEGEEFTAHENAWAKVDVVEKGKKLAKADATKKLVELGVPEDELGDWDKINAAAIENGIARVYYPEVADLLGGGPMGIMASLSKVNDPQHESRKLNWKIILGHESNFFFGKDTAGLDAEVLESLRNNCLELGVYTPERDTRFNLFEVGEKGLPACDYHGNEAVWAKAVQPVGWREHGPLQDPILTDDYKKWIETVPFPALEFWASGVMATWEPVQIGDYFYPIFGLVETARPNAE